MPSFGSTERDITGLFPVGKQFNYRGHHYKVIISGKPRPTSGECKTDTYILAVDENLSKREFKISIKQSNADFLENKISLERAIEILGPNAQDIIKNSIYPIQQSFIDEYLVCVSRYGRTEEKTIKLGWKFEFLNKSGGDKSGLMNLSRDQKLDIYAGTCLSADKKNSRVNEDVIINSGVANMYLVVEPSETNFNTILANMIPIEEYVDSDASNIYFACKALNYRAIPNKWDGDRPLSVYVDWKIQCGKLKGTLNFSNPLGVRGNEIGNNLQILLRQLNINASNFKSIQSVLAPGIKIYL